jgi:formate dehydrogenase subunit gamma
MQPAPLTPAQHDVVLRIVSSLKTQPGCLLEVLHGIQRDLGHVPPAAVPLIADELNLSRAEVHGVVTFYHYFRHEAPGRRTLRLCRAEACQSMGADRLAEHARRRLGVNFGQTTADRSLTLEQVFCLGNCACSPAVMVDDELHGRVTPERLDELLSDLGRSP